MPATYVDIIKLASPVNDYPQAESNCHITLRRGAHYPLCYAGTYDLILRKRFKKKTAVCKDGIHTAFPFSIFYGDSLFIVFLYEDSCITLCIAALKQESSLRFLIGREGESVCIFAV